jgi:hypothetical protein
MTLALAIAASALLVWSTREDWASTRAALAAGAVESHWLYRLAGDRWALLRWAVCGAAVALVWLGWAGDGGWWSAATSAAAIAWSVYALRVAGRNRQNAREMRERAQR